MSHLPKQTIREINPILQQIQQKCQIQDIGKDWLERFLDQPIALAISQTDFAQENLQPSDPYPNISLIIPSKVPKLMPEVKKLLYIIQEAVLEPSQRGKADFLMEEPYGQYTFVRIKFPDVTGGAIRPGIGFIQENLLLTTHIAFLKNWAQIAQTASYSGPTQTAPYSGPTHPWLQTLLHEKPLVCLFLNGKKIGQLLDNIRPQLAQSWALRYYRGPGFAEHKRRIESELNEIALCLNIFSPYLYGKGDMQQQYLGGTLFFECQVEQ